jgi:PAS domain S-box-containing protein
MWTTDHEGHVSFVNEGWLRFTGRSLEQELGDTFAMSAHPDDRPHLLGLWREALQHRDEFRAEYRLRRGDGEYRWVVEVGTPRFSDGEFLGYVGTATDIHERKAMEDALRESEQTFRDVADSAPVMIWTTDPDGLVTFVNEGWMRFTGTTLEEELGPTWSLGVHPEDEARVLSSRSTACAGATASIAGSSTAACPATRRAGSRATWAPQPTSTSARPWRSASGRSTSASTGSPRRFSAACCPSGCRE